MVNTRWPSFIPDLKNFVGRPDELQLHLPRRHQRGREAVLRVDETAQVGRLLVGHDAQGGVLGRSSGGGLLRQHQVCTG